MRILVSSLVAALGLSSPSLAPPNSGTLEARVATLEAQVRLLVDREAIRDLVMEYARSVDDRDWAAHRAVYTDPIDVDYSSMPGAPKPATVPLDKWIAQVRAFFDATPATQHITDVLKVEVRGDHAHATTMLHAQMYMPNKIGDPVQRLLGTYDMDFTRTPAGWKISKVKPNVRWGEGNYWIFLKASGAPLPSSP